ncbi:YdjY domain-containing protein [Pirellulimonas nuda]|uniref:YdjY domain-containing protein n=1 Tax=Pirellulimonas nuda TaxID=2528009 RepID=UPI00119EF0F0|nr:YdjY domain-containing protein [Pirellulimonas nuda]
MSPEHRIWIDVAKRRVYMDGVVSLREGVLEMFACTRHTKEHESIVAAETKAFLAHAALLRVGAKSGKPFHFKDGEYFAPTGDEIEVTVQWLGKNGKMQSAPAQSWVRDLRSKKPMTLPWVFGGSGFYVDEATGTRHYQAESGDFICVSNFSTAMLDVPAESSQSNDGLLFEAFTERIPPLGTPVRLVLQPKSAEKQESSQGSKAATTDAKEQ